SRCRSTHRGAAPGPRRQASSVPEVDLAEVDLAEVDLAEVDLAEVDLADGAGGPRGRSHSALARSPRATKFAAIRGSALAAGGSAGASALLPPRVDCSRGPRRARR